MSKQRTNTGQATFDAIYLARPIPSGCYSGHRPNGNPRHLVEKADSFRPGNARILAIYPKRIVVRVPQIRDFKPSVGTIERADIENVVCGFRRFLEKAVDGDVKSQSTILEIK